MSEVNSTNKHELSKKARRKKIAIRIMAGFLALLMIATVVFGVVALLV